MTYSPVIIPTPVGTVPSLANARFLLTDGTYLSGVQLQALLGGAATPTITVATPSGWTAGGSGTISGYYTGAVPTGVNYAYDGGNTYAAASAFTASGGSWSGTATYPAAGTHAITVQEANATGVTVTSASFNVAASGNALLLDTLAVAPVVAMSSRKLRSAYAGAAMRVQRSSDSTEADIGFAGNGDLDTTALLAFVGSGNGFVTKWYNQAATGTAFFAPAASLYFIVLSGVVQLFAPSGKPAARATTSGVGYSATIAAGSVSKISTTVAINNQSTSNNRMISFRTTSDATDYQYPASFGLAAPGTSAMQLTRNNVTVTGSNGAGPNVVSVVFDNVNEALWLNGALLGQSASAGSFGASAVLTYSNVFLGAFGEAVLQLDANATDRAVIEASQKSYFETP